MPGGSPGGTPSSSSGSAGTGTSQPESTNPKVQWLDSSEEAQRWVRQDGDPYVLFFCSEESAKLAGEGLEAWTEYRKTHKGPMPVAAVFETPALVNALRAAGFAFYVRVPATSSNAELMKKYGATAQAQTLVLCAFNGEALRTFAGPQCSAASIVPALSDFRARYEAWKVFQRAKAEKERAAPKP